ncbi:hypothetical protein SAMN05421762_1356 [Pseudooceanicola nitratireducens]|jgi:hypothetical protein|uniref:Uncharacterized protein n=1 Tax=Pseudooceanicola nitratireducens TaxID=517719 RepID=A0A1I1K762_9RHOB|nr:hypothetical protein SAMN05216183_103436 [Pseudooceanicola nitratireducens]SFC56425.1 hypothetical protein SAMN05421762_1356 [Pseudooceanicola nitratireducens]
MITPCMSCTAKARRRSPQNSCARERKASHQPRGKRSVRSRSLVSLGSKCLVQPLTSSLLKGCRSAWLGLMVLMMKNALPYVLCGWHRAILALAPLLGLSACLQIAIAFGRFW